MAGGKRALLRALGVAMALLATGVTPAYAGQGTTAVAAAPSADWVWVRYLARAHPYSTVRTAAWSALVSSAPDAAIAEFLATGYDYAVSRAQEGRARNLDFVRRVYETTTAEYAPEVHAEAQRLLGSGGTDSARDLFVRSGYEAAKARDRVYRDAVGEQKRALLQRDRETVAALAANDPGEQVRLSASYALRQGATDDDLVEFFAYGWTTGARLDLEVYRIRRAGENMRWRAAVIGLVADAEAAERAAREAGEEAKAQAKAAAVRAWQEVGAQTAPARSGWEQAGEVAARQAGNWHAVVLAATAAQGPNWTSILQPAQDTEVAWQSETDDTAHQVDYWAALSQQALDGEQRVSDSL
ncbi:hypothetical protein [Amycolatopsis sp. CA-126428]|uniref:hypothetical protein n=1 Tax=Amycolatopsis sp. CA-126428 TaxID=2073158 RepID=UPI000CD1043F|nr:hypothetical protein [Amycolatopsis sp. CA-126428]